MEIPDDLAVKLLEVHRPLKVIDRALNPPGVTQFLVHCPACQTSQRTVWRAGDPVVWCPIWKSAVEAKLVEDNLNG